MSRRRGHGGVSIVVTGTDTDVGKTVFTACLAAWMDREGIPAVSLKPLASGPRTDAEFLHAAQGGRVPLDVINPWHFREPIAPLEAARLEGRRVTLDAVVAHVRMAQRGLACSVTEAAGGLLSPLMEGADAPEMIEALEAIPVVVAVNQLGVVGKVRLVWTALGGRARQRAQVVLMEGASPDASVGSNARLLAEYIPGDRIHGFPRLRAVQMKRFGLGQVEGCLKAVASGLGLPA